MTNKRAKELADIVTNGDILYMLDNAAKNIKDWTKQSKANKGISRAINWNMFCKDFDYNKEYPTILKYRMIQEFGDYLPCEYTLKLKRDNNRDKPTHFEPDLSRFI